MTVQLTDTGPGLHIPPTKWERMMEPGLNMWVYHLASLNGDATGGGATVDITPAQEFIIRWAWRMHGFFVQVSATGPRSAVSIMEHTFQEDVQVFRYGIDYILTAAAGLPTFAVGPGHFQGSQMAANLPTMIRPARLSFHTETSNPLAGETLTVQLILKRYDPAQ